jgi:2,4-diketo-3-deoxy-L-fuconate hydrolase
MKLLRIGPRGQERPALLDAEGRPRDLSAHVADIDADTVTPAVMERLRALDPATLPEADAGARIGPCIRDARRFFCIGLNYSDHAAEAGLDLPEHPILFMKACAATGPNDPVPYPPGATKMDWEIELGVVIGSEAKSVSEDAALDHVAGYCIVNDLSERSFQFDYAGQWVKGKSCDGFGPIGPWLVTPDEIGDVQNLDMALDVNGVRRQTGTTKTMVFSVARIVAHLSAFMTLMPGDVIATGTPPGVGLGCKPPVFLAPGDALRLEIGGLGVQEHAVVAAS